MFFESLIASTMCHPHTPSKRNNYASIAMFFTLNMFALEHSFAGYSGFKISKKGHFWVFSRYMVTMVCSNKAHHLIQFRYYYYLQNEPMCADVQHFVVEWELVP